MTDKTPQNAVVQAALRTMAEPLPSGSVAPTRQLPIVTGGFAGSSDGGDRPESITVSPGERARRAEAPTRAPERATVADVIAEAPPEKAAAQPHRSLDFTAPIEEIADVGDDEIAQLHVRFDRMEALIKRRLTIATLNARFDALEEWLNTRF